MRAAAFTLAAVVATALTAAPGAADWLVLEDGTRIETLDGWEVREGLVIFHLAADASLASMRLSEVDLEASAEATAAEATAEDGAAETANGSEGESRDAAAWVITDADVGHVDSRPSAATAEAAEPEPSGGLTVSSWREEQTGEFDGVRIVGTLANSGSDVMLRVGLVVRLLDTEGEELARSDARLTATQLPPATSSNFEVRFPGVFVYSQALFEPAGFALASSPDADAAGAGS